MVSLRRAPPPNRIRITFGPRKAGFAGSVSSDCAADNGAPPASNPEPASTPLRNARRGRAGAPSNEWSGGFVITDHIFRSCRHIRQHGNRTAPWNASIRFCACMGTMNPPLTPPRRGADSTRTDACSPPGRGRGWVGSWRGRSRAVNGQPDLKTRFARAGFKFNFAAVTITDNAITDDQAKAGTGADGFG